ncbi:MAG: energy-coupling factor transporter ATPase [Clostridiales bacterium]|nr:energy-coupling factor transporter ATPase [Clostridiales bacterium]
MIEINSLTRTFSGEMILDGINLNIEKGSFTAILGRNGSGKSTLAKHLNAILIPENGDVFVDGINTKNEQKIFDVRERVGMVFQNPESQAVASIVEDDTAFAPENLGLSEDEILRRVEYALDAAGISHLRHRAINTLSGGQKQLAAVSGILAMRPEYMVFDEGTSMLDPLARKRIIDCVMRLKNEFGISIIWITHYMEEAAAADRVIVLDNGHITADGTPAEIFSDYELISHSGLDIPQCTRLCLMLRKSGLHIPYIAPDINTCAKQIAKSVSGKFSPSETFCETKPQYRISLKNISYSYSSPAGRTDAVSHITEDISTGITAVIGRTGSGKSTLAEIIAGITEPDSGFVTIDDRPLKECTKEIGMVFQNPEYQLFAETIYEDIAYGPKNLGLTGNVLDARVKEAAELTGLTQKQLEAAPYELSGGQKRLAALAGILAMEPSVLVLDEPAAGLDPIGRQHIFSILNKLKQVRHNMTIIFVTHSMEDAAQYADDIMVLCNGSAAAHGTPHEIFTNEKLLAECGLDSPEMSKLSSALRSFGADIGAALTVQEAHNAVMSIAKGGSGDAS